MENRRGECIHFSQLVGSHTTFGIMKYARQKFRVPSPYYKCKLVEVYEIHPKLAEVYEIHLKLATNLELEKYLNIWLTGWIFKSRAL